MNIIRLSFPVWPLGAALAVAGAVFAVGLFAGVGAKADDGERALRPVIDETVLKECSACHMAFPPALLPARSWRALMAGLDNHFGENAALDEATAKHIADYLVANAADATTGGNRRVLRGVRPSDTPLRITELPWWMREHRGEVRPSAFKDPRVKSKANCVACHRGAARGSFDDD